MRAGVCQQFINCQELMSTMDIICLHQPLPGPKRDFFYVDLWGSFVAALSFLWASNPSRLSSQPWTLTTLTSIHQNCCCLLGSLSLYHNLENCLKKKAGMNGKVLPHALPCSWGSETRIGYRPMSENNCLTYFVQLLQQRLSLRPTAPSRRETILASSMLLLYSTK